MISLHLKRTLRPLCRVIVVLGALPAVLAAQAPAAKPASPNASATPPKATVKATSPATPSSTQTVPIPSATDPSFHRIDLPAVAPGQPFPYTIEVPAGWKVREQKGSPVVALGPEDAELGRDPRLVYVRISPASLAKPEETVANIRAADAADATWSAPLVEAREVGGVRGVLVEMQQGSGAGEFSTLVLKMPLAKTSVDFSGTALRAAFSKMRPFYERVLLSVRPRP